MGLGGYLAGKTEIDHYQTELKREYEEVEKVPEKEKDEVKNSLPIFGLSEEMQDKATEEIAKDKKQWVDFMMSMNWDWINLIQNALPNLLLISGYLMLLEDCSLSPYFFVSHSS